MEASHAMNVYDDPGGSPLFYPDLMNLNDTQKGIVVTVERVGASLSLVGVALIFATYWAFKRLRTVPNLFILFASIANAGASIACLIGYDGVRAGTDSALCKTQAFLLEMLMQSDPWWSFAMAVNVYLVFFYGANPASFRKYVWVYCLVCFGIPFIPALVCLLYREEHRGPVYGDATLWCWIGNEWTELRIYTYYLPIWVCIFFSTLIYFAVGYRVFKQRNQLRNLTFSAHDAADANDGKEASSASDVRESADKHKLAAANAYGTAVTEVKITTSVPGSWTPPPPSLRAARASRSTENLYARALYPDLDHDVYGIYDDDDNNNDDDDHYHHHHHQARHGSLDRRRPIGPSPLSTSSAQAHAAAVAAALSGPRFETTCTANHVPPHQTNPPPPPPVAPDTTAASPDSARRDTRLFSVLGKFRARLRHLDPVKLAYLRTSFVFAISILITWAPSSVNRIHNLIHPFAPNYGLNVASAVVLPLQGLWNAIIYFSTSWRACREEIARLCGAYGPSPLSLSSSAPPYHHHGSASSSPPSCVTSLFACWPWWPRRLCYPDTPDHAATDPGELHRTRRHGYPGSGLGNGERYGWAEDRRRGAFYGGSRHGSERAGGFAASSPAVDTIEMGLGPVPQIGTVRALRGSF